MAVAQHGNLVYVINFAGNSNVVGFNLDEDGHLVMIPNSIRYLSATNTGPSSLAFSPDGRFLLVTEKITNNIDVFSVRSDGTLSQPTITPDPIPGIFDVVFSPDGAALIVQTGGASNANASSVSSYLVQADGTLLPVTAKCFYPWQFHLLDCAHSQRTVCIYLQYPQFFDLWFRHQWLG